jgi:molecular chaperone DnaJ
MTAQLRIPRLEACDTCKGSGAAAGSQPETCFNVRRNRSGSLSAGLLLRREDVSRLHAARTRDQESVRGLQRHRTCRTRETMEVNIPAGVETGSRLRVSGEGEAWHAGGRVGCPLCGYPRSRATTSLSDKVATSTSRPDHLCAGALGAEDNGQNARGR